MLIIEDALIKTLIKSQKITFKNKNIILDVLIFRLLVEKLLG